MTLITDEEIADVMQDVIDTFLIPHFISLGMNATGQWVSSVEARAENGRGEIWGMDYTQYLVNGRGPGNMPPVTPLTRWVEAKLGYTGAQATSVAFAVAKKIAREGTDYYPEGTDLLDRLRQPDVANFIYEKFSGIMAGRVSTEIIRITKNTLEYA